MKLIIPNRHPEPLLYSELPLFYLGGSKRNGVDWRYKMSGMLMARIDDCIIAHPGQIEEIRELHQYLMEVGKHDFGDHAAWCDHYIRRAAQTHSSGCLIIWLGEEKQIHLRETEFHERDTHRLVGQWIAHQIYKKTRVVMGGEAGFPGFQQIKRDIRLALDPSIELYESMEEVADRAVAIATRTLEDDAILAGGGGLAR